MDQDIQDLIDRLEGYASGGLCDWETAEQCRELAQRLREQAVDFQYPGDGGAWYV